MIRKMVPCPYFYLYRDYEKQSTVQTKSTAVNLALTNIITLKRQMLNDTMKANIK